MRVLFDSILFLIVTAMLLSILTGCASIAGHAGSHPAEITCKGKGAITGQGSVPAAGGGFSIQADCGDGFSYKQSRGVD
jgi:hypothetical protein